MQPNTERVVIVALTLLVFMSGVGCAHLLPQTRIETTSPTGEVRVETRTDIDASLAIASLAVNGAQTAYDNWIAYLQYQAQMTVAEIEAETAARAETLRLAREALTALAEARALME